MHRKLDPSAFLESASFRDAELQDVLTKIVYCYRLMLSNNIRVANNENQIRDELLINYLKNNKIRKQFQLTAYLFDKEVPEDNTKGRTDIKVQTMNTFVDTSAYYIIECKRLNNQILRGKTGLNAEYIGSGIMRFVNGHYSTNKYLNGMIGFVVERVDINTNVENINYLLKKMFISANTETVLTSLNFIRDFQYHYYSLHKGTNNKRIKLYHLMLDFSANMNEG
ncbi:MAG: hypothetical protein AYP45_01810 [Candidatus Brocadia carolinensis]|uniref:Uncharacterized protein n=1 Tax=Candidatus Brocadia carolinensis TaxID=1004156 RepID=A0A1V4AX83_9BACT|nr:MAG: hypothetical protein AYP45_01810 [Candidatus Brocadia caroliniensis]